LLGLTRAEPKIVTHGPIFASFSSPSTNSDITLKIIQLLAPFISAQSLSLNACRIFCSSSNSSCVITLSIFFFFDFMLLNFAKLSCDIRSVKFGRYIFIQVI
jgi:hypothetical protein